MEHIISQKDKIIIIEDSLQSQFGGGQVVTNKVIRMLKGKAILFDTNKNSNFSAQLEGVLSRPIPIVGSYQSLNLNLILVLKLTFSLLKNNLVILIYCLRNWARIKSVYAPTKFGFLSCVLVKLFIGMPIVFHAHNVYDDRLVSKIFLLLVNLISKSTICVSKIVCSSMPNVKNKTLIYNWMSESRNHGKYKSNKGTKKQVLAVIANYLPYKGHELFLEALSELNTSVLSNVEVRFYGCGHLEQKLRLKVQNLQLKVRFMGFVKLMEGEYPDIDCVIIPSLKPEAFSLVIGEAWMNGAIVLASNIGAHTELINDSYTGYLFKSEDSSSLKDKLSYYLESSETERESVIHQARNEALNYSAEIFEKDMSKILELDYYEHC